MNELEQLKQINKNLKQKICDLEYELDIVREYACEYVCREGAAREFDFDVENWKHVMHICKGIAGIYTDY